MSSLQHALQEHPVRPRARRPVVGPSNPRKMHPPTGHACKRCRRRKTRCDGRRPVCGRCTEANAQAECDYGEGRRHTTTNQMLEDAIEIVQARVHELENTPKIRDRAGSNAPASSSRPWGSRDGEEATETLWWLSPEPPRDFRAFILPPFFQYASDIGFYLNRDRFTTALDSLDIDERPLPALVSAVYLWGIHLSGSRELQEHEDVFLRRATMQASRSFGAPNAAQQQSRVVLQTMQAHSLLASYLIMQGKLSDARIHVSTILPLGLASGLSKIRTLRVWEIPSTALPAPLDSVEEGERIDASWTAVFLDKGVAGMVGAMPDIACRKRIPGAQQDSPWPLEDDAYAEGGYPADVRTELTISRYIKGEGPPISETPSTKELLVRATILWELASHLILTAQQRLEDMTREESLHIPDDVASLDRLLDALRTSLVSPRDLPNTTTSKQRALFVAHTLTYCGILVLHAPFANMGNGTSRTKALLFARLIFKLASEAGIGAETAYICSVVATPWLRAGQYLMKEIRYWMRCPLAADGADAELKAIFLDGLQAMRPLRRSSAIIDQNLQLLETEYATLSPGTGYVI
ncbi:hypothetical protein CYLTODRAFT_490385 [Cylindrobasidium torrendii FP15055 ss-10]|uniref:Zn(2)-C6 fungal-type domain-containing protein n=1 Tax=Cylindrobasidium torrendii FP15055 ss-10 TaxID=1314674 RepID=A0A0D7BB57_9AGAR|nr:hypothetical protein CYLTODRAFT_490385 [Cylindrobasidium torrendii FP15055 ss-10]